LANSESKPLRTGVEEILDVHRDENRHTFLKLEAILYISLRLVKHPSRLIFKNAQICIIHWISM